MKRRTDPLKVVEAAYSLDVRDDAEWLTNLTWELQPLLDGGQGVLGYFYDARTPPADWGGSAIGVGCSRRSVQAWMTRFAKQTPPDVVDLHVKEALYDNVLHLLARLNVTADPFYREMKKRTGTVDYLTLRSVDVRGVGVTITAPQNRRRDTTPAERRRWSQVAHHIAAGLRLRRSLVGAAEDVAVFTPDGGLVHASGGAAKPDVRSILREAVIRQERARGRMRKSDPDGALSIWRALVGGCWSLVDHFERGGRRYLIVRKNELGVRDPRRLSSRESDVAWLAGIGQPNKLIAYALGLSESTVATHLSHALHKLRLANRSALASFVASLARRR